MAGTVKCIHKVPVAACSIAVGCTAIVLATASGKGKAAPSIHVGGAACGMWTEVHAACRRRCMWDVGGAACGMLRGACTVDKMGWCSALQEGRERMKARQGAQGGAQGGEGEEAGQQGEESEAARATAAADAALSSLIGRCYYTPLPRLVKQKGVRGAAAHACRLKAITRGSIHRNMGAGRQVVVHVPQAVVVPECQATAQHFPGAALALTAHCGPPSPPSANPTPPRKATIWLPHRAQAARMLQCFLAQLCAPSVQHTLPPSLHLEIF